MKSFKASIADSKFKAEISHLKNTPLDPGPDFVFKFGYREMYELHFESLLDGAPVFGDDAKPLYYVALYKDGELLTGEKIPVLALRKESD